jgi:RNA polymerase sigma-70 factor (ECF subfamily)
MAAEPKGEDGTALADFDAFFTRHERALYSYLRRLLPSEEVAVEIAQEAFFRAWTHFAEIQRYDRPEAWLYRVATNLAISTLRRRQPVSLSHLLDRRGAHDEYGEPDESMSALLTAPLDIEEQTVERDAISQVLSRLNERERAALLLRAVYGFSHEEIAGALGISTSYARQVLARGRQHFRQLYDGGQERESAV